MTFGFAIIGSGMIAGVHAAAIREIPGARIAGVWGRNPVSSSELAAKFDTKAYRTVGEALVDPGADAAILCLPPGLHAEYGLKFAAAGKHVVVEKPLDVGVKQAESLIRSCRERGVVLAVIFQNRYTPAAVKVKSALDGGVLGRLILGDAYVKWRRTPEYYKSGDWRGTWAVEGGGALINQAIHTIDLLQWFMGGAKTVGGLIRTAVHEIETEDLGVATVEYANGAVGVIEGSTAVFPGFRERIEIHGEKGSFTLEGGNITAWKVEGCREEDYAAAPQTVYGAVNSPAISPVNHRAQLTEIIGAIRDGAEPLVTGEEGIKSLKIVLGIYESSRTGLRVNV